MSPTLIRRPVVWPRSAAEAPGQKPEWMRIHEAADALVPLAQATLVEAFAALADAVDVADLERLITADPGGGLVLEALPLAVFDQGAVRLKAVLRAAFLAGGEIGADYLSWPEPRAAAEPAQDPIVTVLTMLGPKYTARLDLLNPRAVEWLEANAAQLITGVDQATRDGVKAVIKRGFLEGRSPAQMALEIKALVGLTAPMATAVQNYGAALAKANPGLKAEDLAKKQAAYASQLLRYRAQNIARTETLRASNAGQQEIWNQAADQGYLDLAKTVRKWIVTPDDRLCPICQQMTGQKVPAGEPFRTPDGGTIMFPPLHPSCRCAHGLVKVVSPPRPKAPPPPPPVAQPGTPEWLRTLSEVPMRLEGAHAKQVFQDKDGVRWLFKPDETSAIAEKAGYDLMKALGLEAPELYVMTVKGKIGSMQRMWSDVAGPVRVDALASLTAEQLGQVQRHQVADWLASQHDTNDGALLLSMAGHVRAVDKGQALKFLGRDKLDWTYSPNPNTLAYNRMLEGHIAGTLTLDRAALEPILAKAESLTDDAVRAIFRPYAEHAVGKGWVGSVDEVLDKLVARRAAVRQDFDDLYRRADEARERRLGRPVKPFTVVDDDFAADVKKQGWAGRSVMVAGPTFEDAHLLAYEMRVSGGRVLVLEGKVRQEAEAALLQAMGNVAPAPTVGGSHPQDSYWAEVLPVIKHVNFHLKPGSPGMDGTVATPKAAGLKAVAAKLQTAAMAQPAEDVKAMLAHYGNTVETLTGHTLSEVLAATDTQVATWVKAANSQGTGAFEQYVIPPPTQPRPTGARSRIQAQRDRPWIYQRSHDRGEIVLSGQKQQVMGETAYTLHLESGVEAVYVQHGDNNPYSGQGRLMVYRKGYQGTAAEVADTLGQLRAAGLEARLATKEDLELVYLHKAAHAAKLETDASYQREVVSRLAPGMSARDQVQLMREWWNRRLGVADVSRLPGYRPEPRFDEGYNAAGGGRSGAAGHPYWTRFDIDEADLARDMAGYGLTHSLSGGTTASFMDRVLEGNGWALNTEERIRAGLYTGQGMSPEQDQRTGGASYFFTRIAKGTALKRADLVFDPKVLLRTDLISYDSDMYGRSDPGTKARRKTTIPEWIAASGQSTNEAIVKNGLGLLDNLLQINVGSAAEKAALIAKLQAKGITKINGRPIAGVVKVK